MFQKTEMEKACTVASEIMIWCSKRKPPLTPKELSEAMIVALAITLRASKPGDKKWAKKGAKLIGEMIGSTLDLLEMVPMPRKEKH